MKKINTRQYVSLLKELTEEGREVSMFILGNSMSPFLAHGRDEIWFKCPDKKLKKGDMVFFQRDNGQYVMHRICRVKKDGYYMIGDAQQNIEGPISRQKIFAVVTKVKRKGKMQQPGSFWWEFFEHIWLRMIPIRRVFMKIYTYIR